MRCGASEYKLSKGVAGRCSSATAGSRTADQRNKGNNSQRQALSTPTASSPPLLPAEAAPETISGPYHSSRFREAAVAVAQSGTMAQTILQGLLDFDATGSGGGQKTAQSCAQPSSPPPSSVLESPLPPANPQEALSAARAAITDTRAFSDEIKVTIEQHSRGAEARPARISGSRRESSDTVSGAMTSVGGPTADDQRGPETDTTATTRVVSALRGDAVLVRSLPSFVREALQALVGGVDQQLALK